MAYFDNISTQLGIELWLLVIILIWSGVWKLIAMWKAARKGSVPWFIVLAIINTVGILEILYIYVFSEMDMKKSMKDSKKNKTPSKKKISKKK